MRIGKKNPNNLLGKDIWTEVASSASEPILLEPSKLVLNAEPADDLGSSGEFQNGTNNYLSLSDSNDFSWGSTDDVTIECWIKHTGTFDRLQMYMRHYASSSDYLVFYGNSGATLVCEMYGGGTGVSMTQSVSWDSKWHHVAVIKVGSAFGLYFDGEQVKYSSASFTYNPSASIEIGGQASDGSRRVTGYMDNFRVIKSNPYNANPVSGVTDTITIPTDDFTADSDTKLLIDFNGSISDSSSSNHTITSTNVTTTSTTSYKDSSFFLLKDESGYGNVASLNGNAKVDTFKFNEAGVFNGSSSYLSIPDSNDWDLYGTTSGSYTFETWLKFSEIPTTQNVIFAQTEGSANYWTLTYIASNGGLRFFAKSGDATILDTGYANVINDTNWHHISLIRVGSTYGIYVDGIQTHYLSDTSTDTLSAPLVVGKHGTNSADYFKGYLDEIRVYSGNPYSASPNIGKTDTITVPTSAHTSDANTKLLLHLDDNVTDSGNTGHTVTNNNVTFDSAKFGSGMLTFDGSGDYIEVPDNADGRWDVVGALTQNYTIDFWVRHNSLSGQEMYVCQYEDGSNYWRVRQNAVGSGMAFQVYSGGSLVINTGEGGLISDTNWHHVAIIRAGSKYACYLDGSQVNYTDDTSTDTFNGDLLLGSYAGSTDYLNGNMDGIRLSKSNVFNASPNSGKTDTITVPTDAPPAGDPSATTLPQEIVFDGLDGDVDEMYRLEYAMVTEQASGTGAYTVIFNGDSGSNYGLQYLSASGSSLSASRFTTETKVTLGSAEYSTNKLNAGNITFNAKSGTPKLVFHSYGQQIGGTTVTNHNTRASVWNNTDKITSLTLKGNFTDMFGEGSVIKLYKLQ